MHRFATLVLAIPFVLAGISGCSKGGSPTAPAPPAGPYAVIQTYAGIPGQAGLGTDGVPPTQINLYLPQDLTFGPDGLPYILDWNNHRVRRVDLDGIVRTVIGTGQLGDALDGPPLSASLNHPTHISFDPQGRLILSAWHNSKIMRCDFGADYMEAICGDGRRAYSGDGGLADTTALDLPMATAIAPNGDIYVMDQANQIIRKIDAASGVITRVAGTVKTAGYMGDGGPALNARMDQPVNQAAFPGGRMAFDAAGNLYFCDYNNHCVRKIDTSGIITTVAGTGAGGYSGDGGSATVAQLKTPTDIAFDSAGNMYIADNGNSRIRKVDTSGVITTFAGSSMQGFAGDGGAPTAARLNRPYGVAFDGADNLYIADTHNHVIRVIRK